MPYSIKKTSGSRPYKVVKKTTGEVVGSSTNKEDAMASMRARYANSDKEMEKAHKSAVARMSKK